MILFIYKNVLLKNICLCYTYYGGNMYEYIKGYVKGICESLVSNVVPLALTAATILTKGKVSKGAAIGLAAYGACDVAKNAFGVGKNHYLK